MQESAILAARRGALKVNFRDMDRAIDRLVLGTWKARLVDCPHNENFSFVRRAAAHELGIALMASILRREEASNIELVQRVSVLPCGQVSNSAVNRGSLWTHFRFSIWVNLGQFGVGAI